MIKFSIITPTYNRSKGYLKECVLSVKNQKKGDFDYEHIIVDDGSTDGTKEFVANLMAEDKYIKYFFQENSGPAKALQLGVKEATGDYVTYVDDDDLLPSDSLYLRSKFIEKNPGLDWFYGNVIWVNAKGEKTETLFQSKFFDNNFYERLLIGNFIHGGTPVVKSRAIKNITWPKWLDRGQDYYLWLELARPENKLKVSFLDEFVYIYRKHESSFTKKYLSEKKLLEDKIALNNKIKGLHPKELLFLASEAARLVESETVYKNELDCVAPQIESLRNDLQFCQEELSKSNLELSKVYYSRGWKLLEKIRRIIGK